MNAVPAHYLHPRHVLSALTPMQWRSVTKRSQVDFRFRSRSRKLLLRIVSDTFDRYREQRAIGATIARTDIHPEPIFILGHWRTGTTHLHYLLSQDPNMGYVTREHAFRPYLPNLKNSSNENAVEAAATFRSIDGVPVGPGFPGEDEFAVAARCLCSPYLSFAFPNDFTYYDKYLSFDDASRKEIHSWENALLWVMKKASLCSGGRRLVLKSPPHTARVRLLRRLFPAAKFIYVHRDVTETFQSLFHLQRTLAWTNYLQSPHPIILAGAAVRRYEIMMHALGRDLKELTQDQYTVVHYKDLSANPRQALAKIYRDIKIQNYPVVVNEFERYLGALPPRSKRAAYPQLARDVSVTLNEIQERYLDKIVKPWN